MHPCYTDAPLQASDTRLAAQPIALRALQHAGIVEAAAGGAQLFEAGTISKRSLRVLAHTERLQCVPRAPFVATSFAPPPRSNLSHTVLASLAL